MREVINIESILGDVGGSDGKLAVSRSTPIRGSPIVRITSFGDRTAAELARVLERVDGQRR